MCKRILRTIQTVFGSALLLLTCTLPIHSQSPRLSALIDGTRHDLPVVYLPKLEKFPFIGAQDLAELMNVRTYYSEKARKVILYFGNLEVKFTAMNPFVTIGNRVVQLPLEARYADGDIYLPLPFIVNLLEPLYAGTFKIVASDGTKSPAANTSGGTSDDTPVPETDGKELLTPNLTGLTIQEKTNGTLIRIKTAGNFKNSHINSRITRGWLYVDIYGGRIDKKAMSAAEARGVIKEIVPVQLAQMAQLSFKLRGDISSRKIFTDNKAREILVSLATKPSVPADVLRSLESERRKWLIDTIVLDPGHGGRDPGAVGPGGTFEKDITLAIAKYVKKRLEDESDMRVVMTREDDRFVPLKDRTRLANHEQGKLFISIHANSNKSKRVAGLTTYFLGPAKTEEAIEVSRRENAVINYEHDNSSYADFNTESFILLALAQNAYQQESQELAALVQEEITKAARTKDRGVKQAGYYVLIGASMPNILIEAAFISNPREERLLRSKQFQQNVAKGIAESVLKFKRKYEADIR